MVRKKLCGFVVISIFLCAIHAQAADGPPNGSLFFTPEETQRIEALNQRQSTNKTYEDIRLGAVMYYGPDNWTLWLQGERWRPGSDHADLHVLKVAPGEVKLAVRVKPDEVPQEIILKPHQTYQIATGKIIEGGP